MKLGLIAGNGRFPFLVLDAARSMGHQVTVIAAREEAFADLNDAASRASAPIHWISSGTRQCISLMKDAGVTHAVMAGQVTPKIFAGGIVPDLEIHVGAGKTAVQEHRRPHQAVASVLKDEGIELIDSTALLGPMLASPGVMTRRAPGAEERQDFEFGYAMADAIAGLDIGQTIAVKHRAVVAVEAMEGTDEVIARAGHLAGPGVAIVKVAKPGQDMRFDVPVIGLATVQAMRTAGAPALSVDAGKTLMFEREALIAAARRGGHHDRGTAKALGISPQSTLRRRNRVQRRILCVPAPCSETANDARRLVWR
jgi:DUF1009 family protein